MSGFWSLFIMLFVMFYSSDLRKNLIAPTFEPEINTDDDLLKYDVETVYTDTPNEEISTYYDKMRRRRPDLYKKVRDNFYFFSFSVIFTFPIKNSILRKRILKN